MQNGGGEVQRVLQRQIHGVDSLRRHPPLATVYGLSQFGELVLVFQCDGAVVIAKRIIGADIQRAITAPGLRIAHAHTQRGYFLFGLRARGGRHPRQRIDTIVECGKDVLHHRFDFRFCRGREVVLHINLANGIAKVGISGAYCAFPTFLLLGCALQRRAIEIEAEIGIGLGQQRCALIQCVVTQQLLPGIQRLAGH